MSFIEMQEIIADHRHDLVRAGLRGIDLDYLLDARVDHKQCLVGFKVMVEVQLDRWLKVRAMCTEDQWAFFEALGSINLETRTLKKASQALKEAFKNNVLRFHKEAEERTQEARKRKPASDALKHKEPKPVLECTCADNTGYCPEHGAQSEQQ